MEEIRRRKKRWKMTILSSRGKAALVNRTGQHVKFDYDLFDCLFSDP
jgi:hypothetical protein